MKGRIYWAIYQTGIKLRWLGLAKWAINQWAWTKEIERMK
jgi:hypothetical protein